MLLDDIKKISEEHKAALTESKGLYTFLMTVAERKFFLSRRKLTYTAKFRIDDAGKEVRFTEYLKESGFGLSTGMDEMSPGFGFKKESYKTTLGPREGTIQEQADLFGKKYTYSFDYSALRKSIENAAAAAGYAFTYKLTPIGL